MAEIDDIVANLADPYWVTPSSDFPFRDFNREIVPPGVNERFPDGAVGVRADDDFWVLAALPYSCVAFSIEEIVHAIWPEITNAEFMPDSEITQGHDSAHGPSTP